MSYADGLKTPKHNSQTIYGPSTKTENVAGKKKMPTATPQIVSKAKGYKRRRG